VIRPESLFGEQRDTLSQPLDHLLACHRRIEQRLDALERIAAHAGTNPEEALASLDGVLRFFDTAGALHTADEEESVFPRLTGRIEQPERAFLAGLEHDHTTAHNLWTQLRAMAACERDTLWTSRFQGTVERLVGLYRRHIAKEDELLQALGQPHLSAGDLAEISSEMKRRRGV
jgi:hemerythrin-like domain-containing protein